MTTRSKHFVVFRWISIWNLPAALLFRLLGKGVIFFEPKGRLRRPSTVSWLRRLNLKIFDYHAIDGFPDNAAESLLGSYASRLTNEAFSDADLEAFSRLQPHIPLTEKKIRVLIFDAMTAHLRTRAPAFALAEHYRQLGFVADVFHRYNQADALIAAHGITSVRNLYPGRLVSLILNVLDASNFGRLFRLFKSTASHLWSRLGRDRSIEAAPGPIPPQSGDRVLYFPERGISYGPLFIKDQYYSSDPESPLHPQNITHIEFAASEDDRSWIIANYQRVGIPLTFVSIERHVSRHILRLVLREFQHLPKTLISAEKLMLAVDLTTLIHGYRNAFQKFTDARLALLGFEYNFPKTAVIALQSLGVTVAAAQERFNILFSPNFSVILDAYFVHGAIIKRQLEGNPFAVIDEIKVTGDPRRHKIATIRNQAAADRTTEFADFRHVCLVLDKHSTVDPIDNAMQCGTNWTSNLHFYDVISMLARSNPDCAFVLRGKNLEWQKVPAMASAIKAFDSLPNLFIDDPAIQFDRSYRLAAISDVIVARYTTLCDQAMAENVPVLIYAGMPSPKNEILLFHSYPEGIEIRNVPALVDRFRQVVRDGRYLDRQALDDMQSFYYAKAEDIDGSTPISRLGKELLTLCGRVSEDVIDAAQPQKKVS
jgi:hypothetical protein